MTLPASTSQAIPTSYETTSYPPAETFTSKGTTSPATSTNYTPPTTYATPTSPSSTPAAAYRKQSGNRHTVLHGETVAGLAKLYGYTEERFREFNVIGNENVLPGSILLSSDCACDRVSYQDPSPLGYEGSSNKNTGRQPAPSTQPQPTAYEPTTTTTRYQPTTTDSRPSTSPRRPATETAKTGNTSTATGGTAPKVNYTGTSSMLDIERSMLDEINLMRANPPAYVQHVRAYVQGQKNNNGFPINDAVVEELIGELQSSPPLSILQPTECIYTAAKKHGQDLLSMGKTDHVGSDGSWPWDRVLRECSNMSDGNENLVGGPDQVRESVIILLIDDGIPTRGHRKTMMRADWKYAACYKIGKVGYMPNCWVQKYGK